MSDVEKKECVIGASVQFEQVRGALLSHPRLVPRGGGRPGVLTQVRVLGFGVVVFQKLVQRHRSAVTPRGRWIGFPVRGRVSEIVKSAGFGSEPGGGGVRLWYT